MAEKSKSKRSRVIILIFLAVLITAGLLVSSQFFCLFCFGKHSEFPVSRRGDVVIWTINEKKDAIGLQGLMIDSTKPELGTLFRQGNKLTWTKSPSQKVNWHYEENESFVRVTRVGHKALRVFVLQVTFFGASHRIFEVDMDSLAQRDYSYQCRNCKKRD